MNYRSANTGIGQEGMVIAAVAALAMAASAYFIGHASTPPLDAGICIPSPSAWLPSPLGGWVLNTLMTAGVCALLWWMNKEYGVARGSDSIFCGMFAVMAMSNVWVSAHLNSAALMCIINLACLMILMGCYRQSNPTREIFVIGTLLAVGSMTDYAFVFIAPVYLIGAIMLKCFSLKAFVAYLMGWAAPYWVGIGLGFIPLEAFRLPQLSNVFEAAGSEIDILAGLLNIGITVTIGLLMGLSNAVRLYAGNSRRRLFNMTIDVLGIVAAAAMMIDFGNLTAYLGIIYMVAALQIANFAELTPLPNAGWWIAGIAALYAGDFVLMIIR